MEPVSVPTVLRIFRTLVYLFGFGLVALTLHEFFHFAALQALGGEGYITFTWGTGFTHFTEPPDHVWIVNLSGGLFTGVFLLAVFWSGARARLSPGNTGSENTGMEMGAFVWAIGNLAYAIRRFQGSQRPSHFLAVNTRCHPNLFTTERGNSP